MICPLDSSLNFWTILGVDGKVLNFELRLICRGCFLPHAVLISRWWQCFVTIGSKKNHVNKIVRKNMIPHVNFAGFNTNLVPVCSRLFSCVCLCKTTKTCKLWLCSCLMMVTIRSWCRYSQRVVTRGLNSCLTSENPCTTIGEIKKLTRKQKIRRAGRPKVTIPRRELGVLLYFTLCNCAN